MASWMQLSYLKYKTESPVEMLRKYKDMKTWLGEWQFCAPVIRQQIRLSLQNIFPRAVADKQKY